MVLDILWSKCSIVILTAKFKLSPYPENNIDTKNGLLNLTWPFFHLMQLKLESSHGNEHFGDDVLSLSLSVTYIQYMKEGEKSTWEQLFLIELDIWGLQENLPRMTHLWLRTTEIRANRHKSGFHQPPALASFRHLKSVLGIRDGLSIGGQGFHPVISFLLFSKIFILTWLHTCCLLLLRTTLPSLAYCHRNLLAVCCWNNLAV